MTTHWIKCPKCKGEGQIEYECSKCRRPDCGEYESCDQCEGAGKVICEDDDCETCIEAKEPLARDLERVAQEAGQ